MLNEAIVPAAGLGTRLLPATKEQPKEMLPIFSLGANNQSQLKPLLQLIFEQLCDLGIRRFCFIIGRGKRAIEDHFTQDYGFTNSLRDRNKLLPIRDLERFYRRLDDSTIVWLNQPDPRGFGEAVLRGRPFIGQDEFLVHAGDTYVISDGRQHLKRLIEAHSRLDSEATFLVEEMKDPRKYGVIKGEAIERGLYRVKSIEEKPERPQSKLAVVPIYAFTPRIFEELARTKPGKGGEIQLTDAIQSLVTHNRKVYAVQLKAGEVKIDIGNPETYWQALKESYKRTSTR
jgi:UTP--glucose-1-phosphate uridylyltransferase